MGVTYTTVIAAVCCAAWPNAGSAAHAPPVSINPAHAHVHLAADMRTNVRVTCVTPANITRCQFKVDGGDVIDTTLGANSEQTAGYVFVGDEGRCQVTLPWRTFDLDGAHVVVGCRLRDDVTDWRYAAMTVYGSKRSPLTLAVDRPYVIASPGDTVSLLANTSTALDNCSFLRDPADWLSLDDVTGCEDSRICYHGNGLARGQCGVTFNNVTAGDNGRVWLRLKDKDFAEGLGLVRLIVTKRPKDVTLDFNLTTDKVSTMTLNARCSVIGGRPAPTVTWYIAGVEVTEGVASVPRDEWAWPENETTIVQSLTRTLSGADAGKELRCTASFMAEGRSLSSVGLIPESDQGISSPATVDVTDAMETPSGHEESEDAVRSSGVDESSGVLACVLFGLALFLYAVVVSVANFTVFARRRQLCCFKRLSYEGGASLDTDVMDYHATPPPRVTLREDLRTDTDSYLEPIQVREPAQQLRASYFLPTTADASNRLSTKAERTLGLDRRPPLPIPRYVQAPPKKKKVNASTLNKKKKNKSTEESLFMPTPVDQLEVEQQGATGSYTRKPPSAALYADDTPIYGNMFADAVSDAPLYINTIQKQQQHVASLDNDEDQPVYSNFEAIRGVEPNIVSHCPAIEGGAHRQVAIEGGAHRQVAIEGGAHRQVAIEGGDEPVYVNSEPIDNVYGNVDTGPLYLSF